MRWQATRESDIESDEDDDDELQLCLHELDDGLAMTCVPEWFGRDRAEASL